MDTEYPAVLYSRAFGTSKAKLVRTILAHLGFQARILLHRLALVPLVETRKIELHECTESRPT